MKSTSFLAITQLYRACSGSTYIKIGTIQRRLAWPLRKDDTQIREAFQILLLPGGGGGGGATPLNFSPMRNRKKQKKRQKRQ